MPIYYFVGFKDKHILEWYTKASPKHTKRFVPEFVFFFLKKWSKNRSLTNLIYTCKPLPTKIGKRERKKIVTSKIFLTDQLVRQYISTKEKPDDNRL
jgi:hypothetical protein